MRTACSIPARIPSASCDAQMKSGALLARLWRDYVSRYAGDIVLLAPVLALVALAAVSYAAILKFTIDAIQAGDLQGIAFAPVAVIGATLVRAIAIYSQAIISQGLALKVLRDLQGAMFARLTNADFERITREESGRLVSRFINDIAVIGEGLIRGGQVAIRDTITLIGAIASMFYFDWLLTLLVLAVFAIAGRPLQLIAKRARNTTTLAQTQIGALTALLGESISATRVVKTYGLEAREIARADAAFEERRKLAMKLARNRARSEPLLEALGGAALAAVLYIAGMRIAADAMTLGDLVAIIGAIGIATPAARAVSGFNAVLHEGLASLTRIFNLLDEPTHIADRPNAKPLKVERGRVEFAAVNFAYAGAPALENVTFVVEPGETVALVGPSGAGKTTIFNLLPRLYDVTNGAVRIDGQDVRDVTLASLRSSISLVAQEAALFNDRGEHAQLMDIELYDFRHRRLPRLPT